MVLETVKLRVFVLSCLAAPAAGLASGCGTLRRHALRNLAGSAYDVFSYGARGDGVSKDTAAIVCDDVAGLEIFGLDAQVKGQAKSLIELKGVAGAFVHGCRLNDAVGTFLRAAGERCRDITVANHELGKAERTVEISEEVMKNEIHISNNGGEQAGLKL